MRKWFLSRETLIADYGLSPQVEDAIARETSDASALIYEFEWTAPEGTVPWFPITEENLANDLRSGRLDCCLIDRFSWEPQVPATWRCYASPRCYGYRGEGYENPGGSRCLICGSSEGTAI